MFLWLKYHKKLNRIKKGGKRFQTASDDSQIMPPLLLHMNTKLLKTMLWRVLKRHEEIQTNHVTKDNFFPRCEFACWCYCCSQRTSFKFSPQRASQKLISIILCSYASSYASRGFASQEVFAMYLHYQWWVVVK